MIEVSIEKSASGAEKLSAVALVLVLSILVIATGMLVSGYVMHVLWGWFVVPTFGLPGISIAQALGLALIVRAVIGTRSEKKDERPFTKILGEAIFRPVLVGAVFLAVGFVIKAFV